ncbi:MAG: DNA cytosine methyltransferase [Oscillospiraceae bacterium]|nr:DNA cytosine methyltransferase [Oscillospiraceae bacterium]
MLLDLRPGAGNMLGPCWEYDPAWLGQHGPLNTSECPKGAVGSSLSQILLDTVPSKYYLSRTACRGILRRAEERGKPLPPQLELALKLQAGIISAQAEAFLLLPLAFHINQREETIDLGETAGALMRTQNMQMQTFVTQTPAAFAANQRDEVRDLHDLAGALSAQPGMKQQTFVASCLNPWDTQRTRVFMPEGTAPTLAGSDGGGGRNPGGLVYAAGFSANAGSKAGSTGYQEEIAPTLKGTAGGGMMPSVLCLNDQGGGVMSCSEEIAGTLRAQEHGHQPAVLFENYGIDTRYKGPVSVSPTLSARAGTGGNNTGLVLHGPAVYARQRVDAFQESDAASTESARQHKDATDLILQPNDNIPAIRLIRRLVPQECELLQGYPPGWTDMPGASDSARYKALGNSVAVPCVEYLMQGIALVLRAGL